MSLILWPRERSVDRSNDEAGPEWVYCLGLAKEWVAKDIKLDNLYVYVHVRPEREELNVARDILQALRIDNDAGMHEPTPLVRLSFDSLKRLIGPDSDDFEFSYEAYNGAGSVAIPDSQSFRRLLLAIRRLGLPISQEVSQEDPNERPLVLRFIAHRKGTPEPVRHRQRVPPQQVGHSFLGKYFPFLVRNNLQNEQNELDSKLI